MKEYQRKAFILGRTGNKCQALRRYKENSKDLKLNFDTPPNEETIYPNPNCGICYGRGIMLRINPVTSKQNEKECSCITRKRIHLARWPE